MEGVVSNGHLLTGDISEIPETSQWRCQVSNRISRSSSKEKCESYNNFGAVSVSMIFKATRLEKTAHE